MQNEGHEWCQSEAEVMSARSEAEWRPRAEASRSESEGCSQGAAVTKLERAWSELSGSGSEWCSRSAEVAKCY